MHARLAEHRSQQAAKKAVEELVEYDSDLVLAAVCTVRGEIGIAACDISTGRMELEECAPAALAATLAIERLSRNVMPADADIASETHLRLHGRGSPHHEHNAHHPAGEL